ncbi:MAG: nuclear transport factor 2 family protein [Rubrivivax sp.]|nr:nuclear transport factor 2 family protein [Rubrivivax sp.]
MSIESQLKAYEKALNTNDIESILNLYGEAPVFMPQHAPALVGREAVRAGYRQVFETIKLNIEFTIHEVEVVGYTAWARTSSAGRTRILAAGIEIAEGNNELFVFKRENGDWKIHRYLLSTTEPRA